jgi:arsenite-transporting ATPase
VGKTTCAAAVAAAEAEAGGDVLVASTDPAHSLGDALDTRVGPLARRVRTTGGRLFAAEIDALEAFKAFMRPRRAVLATLVERGTYLEREDVQRFVRLSLPGVDELMALFELVRLATERPYDTVVVDTAPTGHTLRLLAMPEMLARVASVLDGLQAKHRFLSRSLGGAHRPDVADELVHALQAQARTLADLVRHPETSFSWVTLPETLSVRETEDGLAALHAAGVNVAELVINRLTPPPPGPCRLCQGRRRFEAVAVAQLRLLAPRAVLRTVRAREDEPRGLRGLRSIARSLRAAAMAGGVRKWKRPPRHARLRTAPDGEAWTALLPEAVRLVFFVGKGGVGKTTCAATIALQAQTRWPQRRWLLLSADPAHSVADVLGLRMGATPRPVRGALDACEIDAAAALKDWRERYRRGIEGVFESGDRDAGASARFDRQVLEDLIELVPPGLDEIMAVLSVARALLEADAPVRYDGVLIDAAPTGHALRLLAMPQLALEWIHALLAVLLKYRGVVGLGELAEDLVRWSRQLRELRALMSDARRAATVVVMRPEELPRRETERLVRELQRRRLVVRAVFANAVTPPGCARCRRTARRESGQLRRLRRALAARVAVIAGPAAAPPPQGTQALADWGRTWTRI